MNSTNNMIIKENEDINIVGKSIFIKGKFSDFDRIFYQRHDKDNSDSLILYSAKNETFINLDLEKKQMSTLNIDADKKYQQVEFFDNKFFCINRELLTIDVFFLTKKHQSYHKRTFYFTNKSLRLKKNYSLIVWEHHQAGVIYRCLLGPLEDGRYINFDLLERYFNYNANIEQVIGRPIFISLSLEGKNDVSSDIVCVFDDSKKSIIYYDNEKSIFFEYNDFTGENSGSLYVTNEKMIPNIRLRKMYLYYPYDFFSQIEKNKLKATERNSSTNNSLDTFVRNRYRELLLCAKDCSLLKLSIIQGISRVSMVPIWKISKVSENDTYIPIDITINEHTGEIYCLCKDQIQILKDSGEKPDVLQEEQKIIKKKFNESEENS